ncbi:DUF31 family putative serine protease [Mesomycoplasma molare]|uniref:DUF31 family protein n=1 Tax=Mesomycoplasma molare TaxID=171288 RepID=A0ABY5TV01_9BACT|nr:hypothetical protein [Mesomycoplasma molare]UWD34169.1 DUF31 family protein [Mesomycoplasma molare]
MKKNVFKNLLLSSLIISPISLTSCNIPFIFKEEVKENSQSTTFISPNFVLSPDFSNIDNKKLEVVKNIFNKNLENKESVTEFIKNRTFQIEYVKTFLELYSDNPRRKFLVSKLETELGTGWVLDKDPSESNSYYVATNIHVANFINKPEIKTNSLKLLAKNNKNYFYKQITKEELDSINSLDIFSSSFEKEIPENYFSSKDIRAISFKGTENYENYKDNSYLINDVGTSLEKITNERSDNFYNIGTAEFKEVYDNSNEKNNIFESIEVLTPLKYQNTFLNYSEIENGYPKSSAYPSGSDFAVIKVKFKDNIVKPKAFEVYDNSPTLVNVAKASLGEEKGEKLFSFGFPILKESTSDNATTKRLGVTLEESELFKGFYKPAIKIENDQLLIDPIYSKNIKFSKSPLKIEYAIDKKQDKVENIFIANQDNDYFFEVENDHKFYKGASGSGVFNKNKQAVGIFYSSNSIPIETDKNSNNKRLLNMHRLLEKNESQSPLIFYLNNVATEKSWLKQHWNEILYFNYQLENKK